MDFNELNNLGKISFNFKDKEKPINFVSSIVADMHLPIKWENILTANYYLNRFEPVLIESLYDYLVPDKRSFKSKLIRLKNGMVLSIRRRRF